MMCFCLKRGKIWLCPLFFFFKSGILFFLSSLWIRHGWCFKSCGSACYSAQLCLQNPLPLAVADTVYDSKWFHTEKQQGSGMCWWLGVALRVVLPVLPANLQHRLFFGQPVRSNPSISREINTLLAVCRIRSTEMLWLALVSTSNFELCLRNLHGLAHRSHIVVFCICRNKNIFHHGSHMETPILIFCCKKYFHISLLSHQAECCGENANIWTSKYFFKLILKSDHVFNGTGKLYLVMR